MPSYKDLIYSMKDWLENNLDSTVANALEYLKTLLPRPFKTRKCEGTGCRKSGQFPRYIDEANLFERKVLCQKCARKIIDSERPKSWSMAHDQGLIEIDTEEWKKIHDHFFD